MKTKPKSIGLAAAIGVFFVVFAGLVLLPAILSSNLLKPRILQAVNQRLPGTLEVAQWRFKWFSGIEAQGIVYDHRQENLFIKVAELKGYRGLAQLIANARNLGGVEIIRPEVLFYLADKPQEASAQAGETPQPAGLPPFSGILKITDGTIRTVKPNGSQKIVAKDVDLFVDASDIEKPITYRVLLTSGDTAGRLDGEGTVMLSANDPLDLKAVQSDARLTIADWELEDVLAILASRGDYPSGKGRLNADLNLQGSSVKGLHLKGNLAVNRLELWGGPLKTDHPRISGISTKINATLTEDTLSFKQLAFRSSVADGSAQGVVAGRGGKQFKGSTAINLAEVFAQLPRTLKLREDTTLSEGTLQLSYNIESAEAVTAFDATARIDRLKGVSNGKPIAWNQPISLKAHGQKHSGGIRLDELSLRSSFINADGRGDLANLQATLSADLAAALSELKKFIDIKEFDGSGKLFAKVEIKTTAPDLKTGSLNLDIRNLALKRHGRAIFPKQDVTADLTSTLRQAAPLTASEFQQPKLSLKAAMARAKLNAARFQWNRGANLPSADGLKVDARFNLQQISDLLRNFDILPATTRLAGNAHIIASGSSDARQLTLNSVRVDTRKFQYRDGQKSIREERLALQTKGKLNFKNRSVLLAPIDISASAGIVSIPELSVTDWSELQKDMKAQARAELDLAKLINAYGDFIQLPQKTRISGNGEFDLHVDFTSQQRQLIKVAADLSPFRLTSESLPPIAEDHVKLTADLKRSPDGKMLAFENIQLNSTPLSVSAAGNVDQAGKRKTLAASGSINLDLKMLSPFLEKIAGPQITITGSGDNPFKLKMVSGRSGWAESLKQTDFTGAIRADSIDAFGLGISAAEIPIRVANQLAGAKLAAAANGGRLNLQPTINLQKEPYMLSLPQDTHILKDVEITDVMAERLLSKIHPVFRGSVQAEGYVDLYMQHFKWPLDDTHRDKTTFAGTLRLKGVRINSTQLLTGLLALVGVRGNEMDFGNLDIDFVARNGRIETSPIRLEIDGYPIELHGSVGFDRSLDYIAKLPITPKLVGNKAYAYLEGVTIDVPIRGNSANPDIDKGTLQKASAGLAEQALQKTIEKGVQNIFEQLLKKK